MTVTWKLGLDNEPQQGQVVAFVAGELGTCQAVIRQGDKLLSLDIRVLTVIDG